MYNSMVFTLIFSEVLLVPIQHFLITTPFSDPVVLLFSPTV